MPSALQRKLKSIDLPNSVRIKTEDDDIPLIYVENHFASAQINLLGGTVLSYQPHDSQPVLWEPNHKKFNLSNGFRRGVPVCWPWFAIHPNPEYPIHGFVKNCLWQIKKMFEEDKVTCIELGVSNLPEFQKYYPYEWDLRLLITIGDTLHLKLTTTNLGNAPFQYSGAFHTYLNVSDINNIYLSGLENTTYYCKERDQHGFIDSEKLQFQQPVNRIYMDAPSASYLIDPGYQRKITISKFGNRTTVVWNPSSTWCQNQTDMEPEDRNQMVCVESVVAPYEEQIVQAGQSHSFTTTISVEHL
jgi:D-hexose-6-phosphate mutarotase